MYGTIEIHMYTPKVIITYTYKLRYKVRTINHGSMDLEISWPTPMAIWQYAYCLIPMVLNHKPAAADICTVAHNVELITMCMKQVKILTFTIG